MQPAEGGRLALRCVVMHFMMHFAFDPTNFPRVLLTLS